MMDNSQAGVQPCAVCCRPMRAATAAASPILAYSPQASAVDALYKGVYMSWYPRREAVARRTRCEQQGQSALAGAVVAAVIGTVWLIPLCVDVAASC